MFSGTLITLGSGNGPSLAQGSGPAQLLGLIAVGFLFGLFSKTLHDKLSEGFKAFVNAKTHKEGAKSQSDAKSRSDKQGEQDANS